jgi:hypothetical protein
MERGRCRPTWWRGGVCYGNLGCDAMVSSCPCHHYCMACRRRLLLCKQGHVQKDDTKPASALMTRWTRVKPSDGRRQARGTLFRVIVKWRIVEATRDETVLLKIMQTRGVNSWYLTTCHILLDRAARGNDFMEAYYESSLHI